MINRIKGEPKVKGNFTGERALFGLKNEEISDSVFYDGESPLKESENISLKNCIFRWKYPLWYCKNIKVDGGFLDLGARAGIWYTKDISMNKTVIAAPKTFRRAENITLSDISMPNAEETLWHCRAVTADRVDAAGDYFAFGLSDSVFNAFTLTGNYSFDGAKNIRIENSRLISKDAFWNAENVTVKNSFISGEYIGWNSVNLTLINCTVESHQGFCYAENLKMENCRVINTDLAFEYSTVNAELTGRIESIKNPSGGVIRAEDIGEIISEPDKIDPDKTKIIKG